MAGVGPLSELVDWASPLEVDISGEPGSLVLLPGGLFVPLLAQRGGACRLLDQDRCSVHALRPTACRAFPHHLELGPRGSVRRLRLLRGVECPAGMDGEQRLHEIRRDHLRMRAELVAHQARVAEWNRLQRRRRRVGLGLETAERCLAFLLSSPERALQPPSNLSSPQTPIASA